MSVITPLFSDSLSQHYLCELIADSQMWQGMCLLPDASAAEIVALIADSPELLNRDAARLKIAQGILIPSGETLLEDGEADCSYIGDFYDTVFPLPRILVRYLTDGTATRTTTSTFTRNDQFRILIEYPVPQRWRAMDADSITNQEIDGLDKMCKLRQEMQAVVSNSTAARLQVDEFTRGSHGLVLPEDSNGFWMRSCELHASFTGFC